jgi:hypothetical protein
MSTTGVALFSGIRLRDFLTVRQRQLEAEVEQFRLGLRGQENTKAADVIPRYWANVPRMHTSDTSVHRPEADSAMNRTRMMVSVPFEGDALLFDLRPSSFTFSPPRAVIHDQQVDLIVESEGKSEAEVLNEVRDKLSTVELWLSWTQQDVVEYNYRVNELISWLSPPKTHTPYGNEIATSTSRDARAA